MADVPTTAIKHGGIAVTPDGALYVTGDAGASIGDSIGGATATRVLFVDTGPVLADDSGLTFDKTTNVLTAGGFTTSGAVNGATGAFTGELDLSGNTANTAGVGITGGAGGVFKSSVVKVGGIITTRILIDLTGLNGGDTAGDIIGVNGAGAAHMGQITAALNGTILCGRVTCLETPAGSNVDVDIWSADEATGVEDVAISTLTNEVQLINHGNWAAGQVDAIGAAVPAVNQYLYLTSGTATDATFTAGKFLIELWGYDA